MNKPKISIITITYNSEKTVRDTFESIRKQDYPDLEYLVIDGESTDGTLKIAEEYRDIISVLVSEPDHGISDAMNKGIKLATGDLIGIIHSDDMLEEGSLEKLNKAWNGETDVYYGDVQVCSEAGVRLHRLIPNINLSRFMYEFCLIHPSTFVTKSAYEKYGVFDSSLKCCMDYELLLRFHCSGARFLYINDIFALYRLGGYNQKNRNRTLNESCKVSIRYGANPVKSHTVRGIKRLKDFLRPLAKKLGYRNIRVK